MEVPKTQEVLRDCDQSRGQEGGSLTIAHRLHTCSAVQAEIKGCVLVLWKLNELLQDWKLDYDIVEEPMKGVVTREQGGGAHMQSLSRRNHRWIGPGLKDVVCFFWFQSAAAVHGEEKVQKRRLSG